ncbi:MAG: YqjK-like family protein [Rhodocyclales bacterium]|nr:YqjK-like family protein [Rhodocyclales bacterium]
MNPAVIELALEKQRLQLAGDALRADFSRHANGLQPTLAGADLAVAGAHWLWRHPQIVAGVGVALLVAKPSRAWRWARRAFFGWQTWRRLQGLLKQAPQMR